MKYLIILLIIFLVSCNRNDQISYNPFEPNYSLKTKTILKNGFELKWACDGGFNTYSIHKRDFELLFFEDCVKPGMIIGENYSFLIDSIENYNNDNLEFHLINFNNYKNVINQIIESYNGKLIEPIDTVRNDYLQFEIIYTNNSVYKCLLNLNSDGLIHLDIENHYR